MTAPGPDWVEQARRLAAGLAAEHAAGARLTDALGGLLGTPAARPDPARPEDDGAAAPPSAEDCRWCPVCAGLAALRGRRPDLVEALADVLASAATALRAQTTHPDPDGSAAAPEAPAPDVRAADAPAPPEETVTHPAPAPVQRIDVA
ncbi:hypothetical protein [Modestobacter sp. VKM Ac-2985]|uniref:hypothetical protein n=1 Tax=Modestobacter sp. VKM Ac-2985 TaxID=3004139 RepID=UPI0022ABA007|nr:hypothetical protein [Modestobacter sp. VKM Ac-2985]MCZ2837289.1 hypothetical protein [Modestobacter sp. VKM Ac-2985]